MKKERKVLTVREIVLFFCSLFLTVISLSVGAVYLGADRVGVDSSPEAGNLPADSEPLITVLFCDIDNNVSYELTLDFETGERKTERLYFDNSVYYSSGFSGMKARAEENGKTYTYAAAVTETQFAALMDYVGGVSRDIDERLSVICGGISQGYHNLAGIAAIRLYEKESENEELCLGIVEEIFSKWCDRLYDEQAFFKLLGLCENDFNYPDYIKLQDNFKKLQK